ncbi:MAG: hypothetical protein DRN99_09765, partial [Thermoproteota archaeon]
MLVHRVLGALERLKEALRNSYWRLRLFLTVKEAKVPLIYQLNLMSKDKLLLSVYTPQLSEIDIDSILASKVIGIKGLSRLVPSERDLKAAMLLKDIGVKRVREGYVLPLHPQVLSYLRESCQVIEAPSVQELKICKAPLRRRAMICKALGGILVKTGYDVPGVGLVKLSELEEAPAGYVRYGSCFYPKPVEHDPDVMEWLEKEEVIIPLKEIPEFFIRDLMLLKTKF